MPRGKRTIVSVEDRIQSTCVEIESLQERIRSKKEELKNLKAEKEKSDAARIIAAVQRRQFFCWLRRLTETNKADII